MDIHHPHTTLTIQWCNIILLVSPRLAHEEDPMEIHHIRNATLLLTLGEHRILVDPMFTRAGTMPGFKMFGGGRQNNPLVELPDGAHEIFEQATAVLVTHEHPDHFDPKALAWTRKRKLPVGASTVDAPNLATKGLDVRPIEGDFLGIPAEVVPGAHGHGFFGWMMGPVAGFYLAHPSEPSVYITGDSVLTDTVRDAITRLRPDVVIAPAGSANFGVGKSIIFTLDELLELARLAPDDIVFNHLESLDHCPTTRSKLRTRLDSEGVGSRAHIPEDGELLHFERDAHAPQPTTPGPAYSRKPDFQKWLTAKFAGT